jgi:hypothetical protein
MEDPGPSASLPADQPNPAGDLGAAGENFDGELGHAPAAAAPLNGDAGAPDLDEGQGQAPAGAAWHDAAGLAGDAAAPLPKVSFNSLQVWGKCIII